MLRIRAGRRPDSRDPTMSTVPAQARVTRRFDTSAERVFDAWLDVQRVRRWFGPGLGRMTCIDIDARVGGAFCIVQQRDGVDVEHVGSYLLLERPRELAFTWRVPPSPESSRVSIEIAGIEGGCELSLVHDMPASAAALQERVEHGWRTMLDAMAADLRA
jgi:uncharacterized protein YndB with AHSA1/START domain